MTICREWSLVKNLESERYAKPLYCRSWSCDICAPLRKSRLMAQAAAGEPLRFLTLTVNPARGGTAENRLRELANAWRVCVKRLRRKYPGQPVEYLAIVELTKRGEPHLHILLRSPYIPQSFISNVMDELIEAPIVDIRKLKNMQEAIRYVAKYVTKAPARLGTCKRYWSSQGYDLSPPLAESTDPAVGPGWTVVEKPLSHVLYDWAMDGWTARHHRGDAVVGFRFIDPIPGPLIL